MLNEWLRFGVRRPEYQQGESEEEDGGGQKGSGVGGRSALGVYLKGR